MYKELILGVKQLKDQSWGLKWDMITIYFAKILCFGESIYLNLCSLIDFSMLTVSSYMQ